MKYRAVFFDLDGTLVASAPGITESIRKTLAGYGISETSENLLRYVGPPLTAAFGDYLPAEKIAEAIGTYRRYYSSGEIFHASVYDGVPQMLSDLRKAGLILCLATAKPKFMADRVLDHFGLTAYFDRVGGIAEQEGLIDKPGVIRQDLEAFRLDPQACLMAGDRQDDLLGAAEAGVDGLGVLYGYGTRAELEICPHAGFAGSPAEAAAFALNGGDGRCLRPSHHE